MDGRLYVVIWPFAFLRENFDLVPLADSEPGRIALPAILVHDGDHRFFTTRPWALPCS